MPNVEKQQRGRRPRLERLVAVAPGALLTAAMLLVVVGSARSRSGWLSSAHRAPMPSEHVVFVAPRPSEATAPATAPPRATTARPADVPHTVAPPTATGASPAGAAPNGPLPAAPRLSTTSRDGADPRLASPRGYVPPGVVAGALRLGTPRPDHAPLDSVRRDSALAAMREEMAEWALRQRIPAGGQDVGKALATSPLGALSADGRRALARAVIVDERRRDSLDMWRVGIGRGVGVSIPLPFARRERRERVTAAEVRAMVERNEARVRRRADSLRWWAESTRVARERAQAGEQTPG